MFDKIQLIRDKGYNPSHIFDIGAYKGQWTRQSLSIFKESHHIMIEANNYDILTQFNKYTNITVINEILNEENKEVIWNKMENTGDSIFSELTVWSDKFEKIKRNSITLDSCIEKYNIDLSLMKNILIKIDCQGAEIPILKGSTEILNKTDFIVMELPLFGKYNNDVPSFLEHIQYMDTIGFKPYDVVDNHYINNYNMQIDMLFINKNHFFIEDVQNKLLTEFKEGL